MSDKIFRGTLYILTFISIVYLFGVYTQKSDLERDVSLIPKRITSGVVHDSDLVFIEDDKLIPEALREVSDMDYDELKSALGVKNDFCIYFEDEAGNLINIDDITDHNTIGVGDGRIPYILYDSSGNPIGQKYC